MDAKWYADWIRMIPASTPEEKLRNLEAADMLEQLANQMPRWISVKERLPEKRGTYLCNYEFEESGRIVMSCDYLGDKGWSFMTANVTHWMPLPEPPTK